MMFKKATAVKRPKPAYAVLPKFERRRQLDRPFNGESRSLTGFYKFCSVFFLFVGLIFSQDALAGNLYEDLNISPAATQKEIKKAWKNRVRSYHPDKHIKGSDLSQDQAKNIFVFLNREQTLEEIEAENNPELRPYKDLKRGFYILMDSTLREKYDEWLKNPDHKKNKGRFKHSAGRSDGRGSNGSGYSGNRAGRQSADSSGLLLHEAILSAKKIRRFRHFSPKENEKRILNTVETLLERNININERNNSGETALYLAIENSYFQIAEILLSAGADPNIPDNLGQSPLHEAILSGNNISYLFIHEKEKRIINIVQAVLEVTNNITVNEKNPAGKTALCLAIENSYFQIVRMLLSAGADPNIPDDCGLPPLHYIIDRSFKADPDRYDYPEIAEEALQLLLQFNADPGRRDLKDRTIIETAMKKKFWNIAYRLLERGAPYLTDTDREILSAIAVQQHQTEILRLLRDPLIASGRENAKSFNSSATRHRFKLTTRDKVKLLNLASFATFLSSFPISVTLTNLDVPYWTNLFTTTGFMFLAPIGLLVYKNHIKEKAKKCRVPFKN